MSSSAARPRGSVAALTVAGSDSGGGAGLQADLRTFAAHGLLGCAAVTAVTAQDTRAVYRVDVLPAASVAAQMRAALGDLPVHAVKTGMLANAEIVQAVAEVLAEVRLGSDADGGRAGAAAGEGSDRAVPPALPLVVDPVLRSTSGRALLDRAGADALRRLLLPLATLVTPNLPEAAALLGPSGAGRAGSPRDAAAALADALGVAALVKGGHAATTPRAPVEDALALLGRGVVEVFAAPRVNTRATHGTGCTLASAIAANLALGANLVEAVGEAKAYLTGALRAAVAVGAGGGPVDHLWRLRGALPTGRDPWSSGREAGSASGQGAGSSK